VEIAPPRGPWISGYTLEKLTDDGNLALSCAVAREGEAASFLVLAPSGPIPTAESLARLHHVHALRGELDTSFATPSRELVQEDSCPVLLLEHPDGGRGGSTLLSRVIGSAWELKTLLRVACGIAVALDRLHARGLVHKDIRPETVFVSVTDGRAWLTSFGIASRLPRERQSPAPPDVIAGTLAYMSPEQTGRMNRSIDSRSDLYSLGVTLHELATGELPFSAANALEWIHCHIAREPAPAGDALPPQLYAIIRKLLAKNAEERYQTAAGLAADLQRCLDQLEAGDRIDSFPLGEEDAPDHLLVPERLYGRDTDVAVIRAAFERVVASGSPELVLVSGYSGIGKSSLVGELHKLLVPAQGLFASGKFDQQRRDIPYATIAQAFQGIVREILGKNEAELARWREHLSAAVEPNGRLLVDLIPELVLVIGDQPPVPELPPQEAKSRFQRVLRHLLGALASKQGALALFLDDLQWLDDATLELFESLFTGEAVRKLLFIGAYRDNEVGPEHPLTSALARIRESRAAVSDIVLGPLSAFDVEVLVADALRASRQRVAPLARLIHDKTGGNPFFAIQFLTGLVDEGLVAFDRPRAHWSWDTERVLAKSFTENVVDFMVNKLERLPAETQSAVRNLACLGNVSQAATLVLVHGENLAGAMWAAVRAGLVFRADGAYGFLHDRVQEAAYALLPEGDRPAAHLRIARLLAERLAPEKREETIFDLVNQYNRAVSLLDLPERKTVAELNLTAGRRARGSSAYASAERYFASGRSVLADDAWETDRALVFELELRRAECELLVGALPHAEERLGMLWGRSANALELASVACLRILLHNPAHRLDLCLEAGLEYLKAIGIGWSIQPSLEDVGRDLGLLWKHVGERSIEAFLDLPLMTDPVSRGTMDVLAGMLGPAYSYSPNLLVLCVLHMTRLSIEHGNTDASVLAYSYLAIILIKGGGRQREAYRFGELAVDLVERRGLDRFKGRAWVVFASGVLPWIRHVGESREVLRRGIQACMEAADSGYAAYGGYLSVAARLGAGDPLEHVQREAEEALSFSQKMGFSAGIEGVTIQLALIRPLRGLTAGFGWLEDEAELERRFDECLGGENVKDAQNAAWVRIRKLQTRIFAGDFAEARAVAAKTAELTWCFPERFELAEYHFYSALAHADALNADLVREHHDKLAGWAADCGQNFDCRVAAVAAELARIEDRELEAERLYHRAIRLARQHGFVQVEALAGELAARFHLARGFDTIANAYLGAARDAYLRWGALGKVKELDERFPELRPVGRDSSRSLSVDLPAEDLDLATVVRVSQALSAEIVLDTLIERILTIAIENAGAERGLLVVPREGDLNVEAQAVAVANGVEVRLSPGAVNESRAPESILRYVARTRESVVLGDASAGPGPFTEDSYVRAARVRSLLCVPLLKQTRLVGLLYLENNLLPQVFTPRRSALLALLASQAAISLENARLHAELQAAQDGLRSALREHRLMNDAIPALVWRGRPDGSAELFNQPYLDYTGMSLEESVGWGWTAVLHADDASEVQRRWAEIRAAGAPAELELRLRRYDGAYRWFLVHVRPRLDENGRVLRWYGTNVDIEDLRRAQDELRRNEALLAEGQRVGACGSFLWRPETDEITFSDELYRIFALEPGTPLTVERVVGRVHPDDIPLVSANIGLARKGVAHSAYDLRLRMPDGTIRHIHTSNHQRRDQEGRQEVIGVMQDLTERRLAEEALGTVRSELAHMTRVASLGALTAAIAHEINQPLSGIMTNTATCVRCLGAEPPNVEVALEAVRRTQRDIKRASDVSARLRSLFAKKKTAFEPTDLNEATREVLALSSGELQRNQVLLRAELADGLPQVLGDRIQLQQVIMNLLLNAAQAMTGIDDRPRELVVRTERGDNESVCLTVKDAGVGFRTEDVPKLFEPFHTTKATGMGIGLSVSRSIIENHGGRLSATPNDDGPGATFSFAIPRGFGVLDARPSTSMVP
jgi:PAS domain S-box-containing protein